MAACPGLKPQAAVDMLQQADDVEIHGPGNKGSQLSEEAARDAYKARTGLDVSNPEDMGKVYAAIDAMRQADMKQSTEREQSRRAAMAKSRGQPAKSGKIVGPKGNGRASTT